jgi:outer membrane protein OmpA-like peptidoglycan-associated protein
LFGILFILTRFYNARTFSLNRNISILFLFFFSSDCAAQSGYDTVKVLFPINITTLDKVAKRSLDSIANRALGKNILIYGYADYLGNEPSNLDLAKGRALNVKDYLLSRKITEQQILICEGIGEVKRDLPKTSEGYPEDRRVAIFIKRAEQSEPKTIEPKKRATQGIKVSEITEDGELIPIARKSSSETGTQKIEKKGALLVSNSKPILKSRFEALSDLKENEVMRIETIHFQPTRHFITKESEPILQELLQTLRDFPRLAINIEGHVCCMKGDGDALDTDTFELKLSENRARFIFQFLIDNGIEANRLGYIGHGKRRPIVPVEETEEDAQRNRRVEIRVVRN